MKTCFLNGKYKAGAAVLLALFMLSGGVCLSEEKPDAPNSRKSASAPCQQGKIEYTDAYPADTAELEASAAKGDAEALFTLGVMNYFGYNVPNDTEKAMRYYRLASDKHHASAQYNVGAMYLTGEGAPENAYLAAQYFKKAAEGGVVLAQLNLGLLYLEGRGVKRDLNQAVKWLSKVAATGEPESCFALGRLYLKGDRGVRKDETKGMDYLRQAAEQGHPEAKELLESLQKQVQQ